MRLQLWKGSPHKKLTAASPRKPLNKPPFLKPVAVLWSDATAHEDEKQPLPIPTPALSFGIVVEDTPEHLTLAKEIFADGDMRYKTSIPRGMILRVIPLRVLKVPREFLIFIVQDRAQGQGRAKWHEA